MLTGLPRLRNVLGRKIIADFNDAIAQTVNLGGTFSALILFFITYFVRTKKGGSCSWVRLLSFYGRFLSVRIASIAPIMTITIITAAIPNSRLPVDAKPEGGEAVGGAVGGGEPA